MHDDDEDVGHKYNDATTAMRRTTRMTMMVMMMHVALAENSERT